MTDNYLYDSKMRVCRNCIRTGVYRRNYAIRQFVSGSVYHIMSWHNPKAVLSRCGVVGP